MDKLLSELLGYRGTHEHCINCGNCMFDDDYAEWADFWEAFVQHRDCPIWDVTDDENTFPLEYLGED